MHLYSPMYNLSWKVPKNRYFPLLIPLCSGWVWIQSFCVMSAFGVCFWESFFIDPWKWNDHREWKTHWRFFQLNSTTSVCPTFARIKDFQIVHNFFFKVANKLGLGRLSYHFSSGFRIPADFKSFVVSFFFDSEIWHFKKIVLGAFLSLIKKISANLLLLDF